MRTTPVFDGWRRAGGGCAAALAVASFSLGALAAPPFAAVARGHRTRPKVEAPPPLPAPQARLTLDAPSPDAAWTLRLENTGTVPLQISADARFLEIELAPAEDEAPQPRRRGRRREASTPLRCALPLAMRPPADEDRTLVLPPGRAFTEKLDPRLFCFGAKAAARLVPGAKVTPRLVTPASAAPAVGPVEGLETPLAAPHTWVGVESVVGAAAPAAPRAIPVRPLAVRSSPYVDVDRAGQAVVTVTVTNTSPRPVTFLLRPETLAFEVTGPSGVGVTDPSPTVKCTPEGDRHAPIAEVYSTLASGQQASLAVMLAALCPDRTFDHAGVYAVRAKLDTQHDPGPSIGLHPFDGEVGADAPSLVRVRSVVGIPAAAPRPQLAEAPQTEPHPTR